jgi:hypothetical protein
MTPGLASTATQQLAAVTVFIQPFAIGGAGTFQPNALGFVEIIGRPRALTGNSPILQQFHALGVAPRCQSPGGVGPGVIRCASCDVHVNLIRFDTVLSGSLGQAFALPGRPLRPANIVLVVKCQ